ncbi:MAG: ATP-binding cassette domain-containing protein [Lachnospiraceae bacterium]|jgi:putative ABC transport system ATP-binding protein|nr:ATP-binding cassette domain-containing protein [Lachnospiraceae bacterium]
MIEITNLHKAYGEKALFEDFCLTIKAGEFVVFSGASGCGKTTLLNMIGALEKPDSGHIIVEGIDLGSSKNRIRLFRETYGFVFQNFALVDNKTVEENLAFVLPKYSSGLSVEEALNLVGLSGFQEKKVYSLSGGEQQRVSLARLMLKKCSIVLADEPTGSLDKGNANVVIDILENLNEQGKTVVLATHDEAIKKRGGRVIELGGGEGP